MSTADSELTFVQQDLSDSLRDSHSVGGCAFTCSHTSHKKPANTRIRIAKPGGEYPTMTRGLDYILAPCRKSSECKTTFLSRNPIHDSQYRESLIGQIMDRLAQEAFMDGKETHIVAEDIPSVIGVLQNDEADHICLATLSATTLPPYKLQGVPLYSVETLPGSDVHGRRNFQARSFDFHIGSLRDPSSLDARVNQLIVERKRSERRNTLAASAPEVVQGDENLTSISVSITGELAPDHLSELTTALEQSTGSLATTIEPDTGILGMISRTHTDDSQTSRVSLRSLTRGARRVVNALRGVKLRLASLGTVRRSSAPDQVSIGQNGWIDATGSRSHDPGAGENLRNTTDEEGTQPISRVATNDDSLAPVISGPFELSAETTGRSGVYASEDLLSQPGQSLDRNNSTGGASWKADDDGAVPDRAAKPVVHKAKRSAGTAMQPKADGDGSDDTTIRYTAIDDQ